MDCKAFTFLEDHSEICKSLNIKAHCHRQVNKFSPKPIESIVEFDSTEFHEAPSIFGELFELLEKYKLCKSVFVKIPDIINEFGKW